MATKKKKTLVKDTMPTGHSFEVEIPEELDVEPVRIAVKAVIGTLLGINKITDPDIRRSFYIRFLAEVLEESNVAIHNAQMANKLADKNPTKAIEELLKSIHKDKDSGKQP
jgi:hypothetical protein